MPSSVARTTYFGFTPTTLCDFGAVFASNISWLNPLSTFSGRAVNSVLGGEFSKFSIPSLFEIAVEKAVDVPQRNVVLGATSWRHMLRIRRGEPEDTLKA
jgi:hypothetical protein